LNCAGENGTIGYRASVLSRDQLNVYEDEGELGKMAVARGDIGEESRHGGIQVVARSAAIMRALGANPAGLSLASIAQEVGLARSTVQRIVGALESENLIESIGPNGGFRLGPALGQLMYATRVDIISEVHPHLVSLSEMFLETSVLGCQAGSMMNAIDRVIAERMLRIVVPIGASAPLYATALGRAVLSLLSAEEVDLLLGAPIQKLTARTLSASALKKELARIRVDGFAMEMGEFEPGISTLAVPLRTYMGTFSIGLAVPVSRLENRTDAMRHALFEVRRSIEVRIGVNLAGG
jgi:DNA-binding IclR family transcriptional regulator